ncbi:DUF815 domain-containing protein [Sandaracinobacteroides hominis]|uniref:DUF815 domain-containing protein n=1 Tax=Sandaracinobacteroides hominis TaxID=2780086 RepID=UPI0018F672D6|nr:DUF815 domain-containing protein [Sandaracinobacteroides hominis]
MKDTDTELMRRIAEALERIAPEGAAAADPAAGKAFLWDGGTLQAAALGNVLPIDRFAGVDAQRDALIRNIGAHARGDASHDMLLWGARGMGKSALIRSVAVAQGVALVQASGDALHSLPALFAKLQGVDRPFILYVDDLAFAAADPSVRVLRSLLDGGIAERPANVRLAVTSNHRHLVEREATDSRHARDAADDQLALVDRFGMVLGFHVPDQDSYLEMVRRHLAAEGLDFVAEEATAFALARGGRSGRTAWHFRTQMLVDRAQRS